MKVEHFPTVTGFNGDGSYKYVVAEIEEPGPRGSGKKKTILRFSRMVEGQYFPHRKIGYQLMNETVGLNIGILGGGCLTKSGETIGIAIPSRTIGREEDPNITVKILGEAFPGCEVVKGLGYED